MVNQLTFQTYLYTCAYHCQLQTILMDSNEFLKKISLSTLNRILQNIGFILSKVTSDHTYIGTTINHFFWHFHFSLQVLEHLFLCRVPLYFHPYFKYILICSKKRIKLLSGESSK